MGSVQFGIPRALALSLKDKHGLVRFVETGTLVGHTSLWASDHFTTAVTVDIEQKADFSGKSNIFAFSMDSAYFLETSSYDGPTLYWLDAHTNESCPVLREIAAINENHVGVHVILVDDARLFGDLPDWPTKEEVVWLLINGGKRTVLEVDDVLVAEPCP